jgi:hypothetical protein
VAASKQASEELLTELSHDESAAVRLSVVGNKRAPDAVHRALRRDPDPAVASAVKSIPLPANHFMGRAWFGVWLYAALFVSLIAALGAGLLDPEAGGAVGSLAAFATDLSLAALIGWGVVVLVVFVFALIWVSKPLSLATSQRGWTFAVVGFYAPFLVLMPVIGSVMALVRAITLLRGRIGAQRMGSEGSYTYYDPVTLKKGEGKPAGALLATGAVLHLVLAGVIVLRIVAFASGVGDASTADHAVKAEPEAAVVEIARFWAPLAPVVVDDDPQRGDLLVLRQLREADERTGREAGLELAAYRAEPDALRALWTRPLGGDPAQALDLVHVARAGELILKTNATGWASLVDMEAGEYRGNSYRLPAPARAACAADETHAWIAAGAQGVMMKGVAQGREVSAAARPAHCHDPADAPDICPAGLSQQVRCAEPAALPGRAAAGTRNVVTDGATHVAVLEREVIAFDRRGRRRWAASFSTEIEVAMPAGDRVVVVTAPPNSPGGFVAGLDGESGDAIWIEALPGEGGTPAALAASSSRAYVLRGDRLHSLALTDGQRVSYRRDAAVD